MNKKYGGLVSNPRNTKDTQVVKSTTYTTNGTVVETVNLNAWPAVTESDTPTPEQGIVSINPDLPLQSDSVVTLALPATEEDVIEHLKAWIDDDPGSYFVTRNFQDRLVLTFEDAPIYSIVIDNTGTTLTFTKDYVGAPDAGVLEWV